MSANTKAIDGRVLKCCVLLDLSLDATMNISPPGDRARRNIEDSADQRDLAFVDHFAQDRALLSNVLHGEFQIRLGNLLDELVVL